MTNILRKQDPAERPRSISGKLLLAMVVLIVAVVAYFAVRPDPHPIPHHGAPLSNAPAPAQ